MALENVVIITNQASTKGGAEKVACRTAMLMAERGLNAYLFAGAGPVSPELAASRVHVACLGGQFTAADGRNKIASAVQGFWNVKAGREISNLLSRLDPETTVVNLHSWTHTMSSSILESVRRAGFPLLITAHDYFLACPNGGFYNYVGWTPCALRSCGRECRRTNCDKRSFAQKKYRVARFDVQTRILKKMKPRPGIIFLSRFSESVLRESIPFAYDIYQVDNPIEADWDTGLCNPSYDERPIDLLYVGRVDPEKDCALFCRVAKAVGGRAVAVGDGSQRVELAAEYPCVEFVGSKGASEVRDYYKRAKCLIFPSSWYEVQSLVLREAQVAGSLPCALRGGTSGEDSVRNGLDGIVVPHDDENALIAAAKKIIKRETNDQMRSAIADQDFTLYRPETFAARMIQIYEDFLATRGGN